MGALQFMLEGLRDIRTVGTISRSSRWVCESMLSHVNFDTARCIVEFGAGDGPITEQIISQLKGNTQLLSFEVNPRLCEELRANFKDPRVHIINDSAELIGKYLKEHGFEKADYVVSALPFVSLPEDLGDRIMAAAKANLSDEGKFIQLNYSLLPRKRYESYFGKSTVDFVLRNLPPAFIFACG